MLLSEDSLTLGGPRSTQLSILHRHEHLSGGCRGIHGEPKAQTGR